MEPIFGFILYFIFTIIVGVVAHKRGRSGWLYSVLCIVIVVPFVMFVAQISRNAAGPAAFLIPISFLVYVLSIQTGKDKAAAEGEYGDYKKCPFCAESVKKEAVKCKHCGSQLSEPSTASDAAR